MRNKFRLNISLLLAVAAFAFSMLFAPLYVGGDQAVYAKVYSEFSSFGLNIFDDFTFYQEMTDSREPGYFILVKIVAPLMDKFVFGSMLNAALVYFLARWLAINRVSWVVRPLIFGNFYLLVLFFSADRLKVALIFLLIAEMSIGRKKYFLMSMGIFSHIQILFLVLVKYFVKAPDIFRNMIKGKISFRWRELLVIGAFGIVAAALGNQILLKFSVYNALSAGADELVKPLAFLIGSIFYAKEKWLEAVFAQIPVLVGCYFLGSDRLVIFSFIIFMFYALKVSRGLNFGVLMSLGYFFFQGVIFLQNIVYFGDGFASA